MWREQRKDREEFEKEMKEKFPKLYAGLGIHWRDGGMLGIGACKGWYPIIRDLSEKIEPILEESDDSNFAVQIKEKFGTLRYYMNVHNEKIQKLIAETEKRSCKVCEWCGAPAYLSDYGWWIKTLCESCHEKRKKEMAVKNEKK